MGVIGGLLGGAVVFLWWPFFSRAPRLERWGAVVLVVVAMFATPRLLHESVATGNMGFQFFLYAIPVLSLAFVVWAVAAPHLRHGSRRLAMVATIVLACGAWTLVRRDGVTGDGGAEFAWRWSSTVEETLLADGDDEPAAVRTTSIPRQEASGLASGAPVVMPPSSACRSKLTGRRRPRVEMWRRPIGPAVSSVAVHGDLLYTQEQRGDDEVVASYQVSTGEPVWRHRDVTRFWDSHVGTATS